MKKYQKTQAKLHIEALSKLHEEIRSSLEQNSVSFALEQLASCQEKAIELGNLIEEAETAEGNTENIPVVPHLEEYCETVFSIYEELQADSENNPRKILKRLNKALIKADNSLRNDVKVRREAVFFPYKASMWDSLESVWRAADADPDCDAYVVPIPYYDKNPDGSFRQMHYEGDQYPKDVPVTNYEKYDFEARRPDEIYIHNGYDSYNIVTSVHPRFYSENLKKYTDCLVYIPYFVLAEPNPDNPNIVKSIGHFCTVSAVFHADRVIVQSEAMKQVYIKALMEVSNDHSSAAEKYWNNKIEGTGSPKLEKVANTKKEDLEIPKEWLSIINKPDGTPKKIVFYNNSIGALLRHNENMIAKMKSVFEIFKENKDEIALLWRPHPLIESTLTSMRPQLWAAYKEIRDNYLAEGWGIYDDTPDIDRAVVLSDAYYGDPSSVVQMYQTTGKPIMIQNVRDFCAFNTIISFGDMTYLLSAYADGLFTYNKLNGKIKFCGAVRRKTEEGFLCAALHKDVLYFPPNLGDEIVTYDIGKGTFGSIALERLAPGQDRYYIFCFHYENKIYMIGRNKSIMLCLNTEDNTVVKLDAWQREAETRYGCEAYVFPQWETCVAENCFWVALKGDRLLLQYNMETEQYRFWQPKSRKMQYQMIRFDGEYFWLSGEEKVIVRWKKETGEVKEFDAFPDGFSCGTDVSPHKGLFSRSWGKGEHIYFAPLDSNMLLRLNQISGEMECVLKITDSQIICPLLEIDGAGFYVQIKNIRSDCVDAAYIIQENGSCKPEPNLFQFVEDESLRAGMKRDLKLLGNIIEPHPRSLGIYFDLITESEESLP